MKKAPALILLTLLFGTEVSVAQNAILDYQGYAWEDGGFPPSDAGDVLNMAGVIDDLDVRFGIDLGTTEVTLWVSDLLSTGQIDIGGGILSIAYDGGSIELWSDNSQDHDFGTAPPNATVPSTFRNGQLLLGGSLSSFFLFFDPASGTGAYEASCSFTSGSGLVALNQINGTIGYTFGGVLDPNASGGNVPEGYDLQTDGNIEVVVIVGAETKSWGAVKSLYRTR